MGRPLGGKTLFKKYRLGDLDLRELGNNSLLLLIGELEKETLKLKEDVSYTVKAQAKSQYKTASEMGVRLSSKKISHAASPTEVLMEIFKMIMGSEDEGEEGVSIRRSNYTFTYKKVQ